MMRTACLFAIWTMACMVGAIVGFYFVADLADGVPGVFSRDNPSWGAIGFLAMFAPVAGAVAGLSWALFHRAGRRPGWPLYGLMALLVVGVSHMLVFGAIAIWGSENPLGDLVGAVIMFVIHGWLSVPVAFIGTALFVSWNRRREAAAAKVSAP